MIDQDCALLIHDLPEPFGSLEPLLKEFSAAVWNINSDALDQVAQHQPALIFVDLPIWTRSPSRIISLAWSLDPAANVIVVGSKQDIELYVSSIERGAFSFVAPPFSRDGLRSIVNTAFADVRARREALGRSPFANPSWPLTPAGRGLELESCYWGRAVASEVGKKRA